MLCGVSRVLFRFFGVVCTAHVSKEVGRKLRAVVVSDRVAMIPVLIDEVVGNSIESVTDGSLRLFPFPVHDLSGLLGIGVRVTAVGGFGGKRSSAGRMIGLCLLSSRELGDQAGLKHTPCVVVHWL
jgi:hypothetical protein